MMSANTISRGQFKKAANNTVIEMADIVANLEIDDELADMCGVVISLAITKIETKLFLGKDEDNLWH